MKNIATLVLLLISVSPCREVLGREVMAISNIKHWLRALDPPANCANAIAGDKVTDPHDCTKFFVCMDDGDGGTIMSPDSYSCPDFNPVYLCFDSNTTNECSADPAICKPICTSTPNTCTFECSAHLQEIANVNDCSKHSVCIDNGEGGYIIIPEEGCPSNAPYFDGIKCGTDESACCNCQLEACGSQDDLIADPQDCHSYYYCEDVDGALYPIGPLSCGSGKFFNIDTHACEPTAAECQPSCLIGNTTRAELLDA